MTERLNPKFQELRREYLHYGIEEGMQEAFGFNNEKMDEHGCWELNSDLFELFDKGTYNTNNEKIVNQLIDFLKKEGIEFSLKNKPPFFKFALSVKYL